MMQEERATLTQRRAMTGSAKLDRSKLRGLGNPEPEEKGSAAKVVIGVLIIIVLAAGAWLALDRFVLNNDAQEPVSQVTPTPTAVPTVSPTDKILSRQILADTDAVGLQGDSKFIVADQAIGEASEDAFTIESLALQPYETFMRVEWLLTSDGDNKIPETVAVYDKETTTITVTFNNVLEDKSDLGYNETAVIPASIVDSIRHDAQTGTDETYVVTLKDESGFVLHSVTEGLDNKVVLDIKEKVEEEDDEDVDPTPTGSVTPTPSTAATSTPAPTQAAKPTGVNLSNEFSKNIQYITTNTVGNSVGIAGYLFKDEPAVFKYYLRLAGSGDPYPNTVASYNGNKLTLEISNLAYDALPDGSGKGMTDFASKGVRDITKVDITFAANKSTYVFDLTRQLDYRIYIDEANNRLNLEIKR
ncbi:MAG: hypothetical protein UZ20_WS6002000558 [candidate division WS6 bacterium OLB21]|uniref:Uncharacterized protein n=1 Tax=candidate division WS6 bacterium OLB21 TaxID=1617427 RepID=A0A136KJN4_9BACT|nr:MAG: hypothetical protein UZ20_WS6002000558 [candidate division WS6 bacterium OLB21]